MARGRGLDGLVLTATSAGVVAWQGFVLPRLPPAVRLHTPVQLGLAGLTVAGARAVGHTWDDLGLDPGRLGAGLRLGAAAYAASGAAYGLALLLPDDGGTLPLPEQELRELLEHVLVHVPVGTVLAEELLFRGVLHALARRALGEGVAERCWTAAVFALWHLRPGLEEARRSPHPVGWLAGTFALTALGDLLMGWLRRRSGSLLAPIGLHLGTNSLGLVAAHLRGRLSRLGG